MQSRIQDYTHQLIRDQMREYFETHIQKKILSKSPEPQDMVFPHQVRKLMIPSHVRSSQRNADLKYKSLDFEDLDTSLPNLKRSKKGKKLDLSMSIIRHQNRKMPNPKRSKIAKKLQKYTTLTNAEQRKIVFNVVDRLFHPKQSLVISKPESNATPTMIPRRSLHTSHGFVNRSIDSALEFKKTTKLARPNNSSIIIENFEQK